MKKFLLTLCVSTPSVKGIYTALFILILSTSAFALLSTITKGDNTMIFIVNGLFTIILLILFYSSNTMITKLFSVLGVVLFFLPLLFYGTEKIISTERYYFLQFLVIGFIIGIILMAIEIFKKPI